MRPLRLSIRAFGPYLEKTEIDFTAFNEAGLFLITGPTGGGKTAVLDAMSFALFGRATGGRRSFDSMRCARAPESEPTEAELDFMLDGRVYRFRRTRHSHINRSSKKLEYRDTQECFEKNGEEFSLLLSGSDSAVRAKAEELLHLTSEQFSQVMVLPQGDFLKLLRANSREKGEMLRTLFSADRWKRLTDRANERVRMLGAGLSEARAQSTALLNQQEVRSLQELKDKLSSQEERVKALGAQNEDASKVLREARARLSSAEEWERLCLKLENAEKLKKAAESRLESLEKAAPLTEKKRGQAEKLRENVIRLTDETVRLEGRLKELKELEAAKLRMAGLGEEKAKKRAELSALDADEKQLLERIDKGEKYLKRCREAAGALPTLTERRQSLKELENGYAELKRLESDLTEIQKALAEAEKDAVKKADAASLMQKKLSDEEKKIRQNAALNISHTLKDGEPCPVCGSIHHPHPAQSAEAALSESEINTLRALEQRSGEEKVRADAALSQLNKEKAKAEELYANQKSLCEKYSLSPKRLADEIIKLEETLKQAKKDSSLYEKAGQRLESLQKDKEALVKKRGKIREELSSLLASEKELESRINSFGVLSGESVQSLSTALEQKQAQKSGDEKTAARLRAEAESESRELERAREGLSVQKEAFEKALAERDGFPSPWEEKPQTESLREELKGLEERASALSRELGSAMQAGASISAAAKTVEEIEEKSTGLEKDYSVAARLSGFLSGNNPQKLPILQYVLSIMLEEVLISANRFFQTLSRGRYALRLMDSPKGGNAYGGLDLEVLDGSSMLPRSIETLSGGEQFLASLSLAFGLSEVVQNHSGAVRLDSLFIDEGFGSLDGETLDTAMKALSMLRQGGRLIGIISHVSELKNRVPCQIQVTRDSSGCSHAEIRI